MVQNAVVTRVISEDVIEVSLMRQLECGLHCSGQCEGCGQKPTDQVLALATNPIRAKEGDYVEVEPASGRNLLIPVIVFVLPCIGLGVGYAMGQSFLHLDEIAALGTALLGLAAGFVPAFLMNRAIVNSKAPEFRTLKFLYRGA